MDKISLFRKNDILILVVLLILAVAGFFAFRFFKSGEGNSVLVTVDGELLGEYELEDDSMVKIEGKVGECILVIEDGMAYMNEADCPNQICVNHSPISFKGETIVCLPNRVIIEIN